MQVKELIEMLKEMRPDLEVGRVGHYGEFIPMDRDNFWGVPAKTSKSLKENVLHIEPPFIGPEPD